MARKRHTAEEILAKLLQVDVLMLSEWEQFNNLSRPHGAFNGKAPYEILANGYN